MTAEADDFTPVLLADRNAVIDGQVACFVEGGAVVTLLVRHCGLTSLPESLGQFSRLEALDLRSNRLTALPDSIARLPSLSKLDLRWNKLRVLPKWLPQLEARGCVIYQ